MNASGIWLGDEFADTPSVHDRARRAAAALLAAGIGPGERVALLLRNDIALFEVLFGAAMAGAVPVPVNWHGTWPEIEHVLQDSGARLLVVHADLHRKHAANLPPDLPVVVVPTPDAIGEAYGIDPADRRVPDGATDWDRWIGAHEADPALKLVSPASMIYTSGTTGRPKGVRRAHISDDDGTARRVLKEMYDAMGIEPGMSTIITGPMYHSAPNGYALGAFRGGGTVVLQPRFDPEQLLQLVERHRITHLHVVPIMFVRLLRLPEEVRRRYDTSSLRRVTHAAAPCPRDVKRSMIEWWGPIIHEYYGATESGAVVACDSAEWLAHPGTVGKALPSAVVKIVGPDGREVPAGTVGEILVRLQGLPDFTYENHDEDRRAIEREGMITCGDIGYLDEDGFLHLCDRAKDMVISGGVNIYPAEIEATLLALEGVRDVAVFGVPDEEYGEALAAAVEVADGATLTADDVRAHVRSRLAGFKVPKVVEFHDALPREDSGKIFKRKLRDPYWEGSARRI